APTSTWPPRWRCSRRWPPCSTTSSASSCCWATATDPQARPPRRQERQGRTREEQGKDKRAGRGTGTPFSSACPLHCPFLSSLSGVGALGALGVRLLLLPRRRFGRLGLAHLLLDGRLPVPGLLLVGRADGDQPAVGARDGPLDQDHVVVAVDFHHAQVADG